jgi:hypothetical protein
MGNSMNALGVDLAAKPKNPTGVCSRRLIKEVHSDDEILDFVKEERAEIVGIDAPLTKTEKPWRPSDRSLIDRGFRPLPLNLKGMRELTERGIEVKEKLLGKGVKVLEVFPRASEEILGLNDKKGLTKHGWDAYLAFLTVEAYLADEYESLDGIIVPKPSFTPISFDDSGF